jgi:hypothetical protein
LPELCPALFEADTIGVQTLDQDRILLEESGQTGLEDGYARWLWHGFLDLVDHRREVVLEVSKETLALEYEPFDIGLRLCSQTVQVCLLHDLVVITGTPERLVQLVHNFSPAAVGFTQRPSSVLLLGWRGHT